VLAAQTTHPALAVLELKSALEEALRDWLGRPEAPTPDLPALLKEIDRQEALSRRNSVALKDLVTEMTRAESAVTRTEPIRIPATSIRKMHDAMTAILSELAERRARRP
jgi:hypothetical protein